MDDMRLGSPAYVIHIPAEYGCPFAHVGCISAILLPDTAWPTYSRYIHDRVGDIGKIFIVSIASWMGPIFL